MVTRYRVGGKDEDYKAFSAEFNGDTQISAERVECTRTSFKNLNGKVYTVGPRSKSSDIGCIFLVLDSEGGPTAHNHQEIWSSVMGWTPG